MKPINSILAARPTAILRNPPVLRSLFAPRFYSIQSNLNAGSSGPKRRGKAVTPFNDDGFVPWNELSVGEKAGRAVQQSFNFGLILVGLVLTGGVGYFLWTDVFSPDSKTANFNRAVNKVKADPRCIELLGDPNKLTAHGEETFNKWSRARPLSSTESTDNQGSQHLMMRFYVRSTGGQWLSYLLTDIG
ncbi:TIM21-domain-containing protein [Mariannaea sp. PMI_226]|nr:TIM21-domain-containing protein [Mariannaea sp. PMI_226]